MNFNSFDPNEALACVQLALKEDYPLFRVVEAVEKAVIISAFLRHPTKEATYAALRVPKTTFYAKWRKYSGDDRAFV